MPHLLNSWRTDWLNSTCLPKKAHFSTPIDHRLLSIFSAVYRVEACAGFHFLQPNGSYAGAFSGNLVDFRTWEKRAGQGGALKVGQWLGAGGDQVNVRPVGSEPARP